MQGRKPTREEWKLLDKNNLNSKEWLIQKNSRDTMQLIHRTTNKVVIIQKD